MRFLDHCECHHRKPEGADQLNSDASSSYIVYDILAVPPPPGQFPAAATRSGVSRVNIPELPTDESPRSRKRDLWSHPAPSTWWTLRTCGWRFVRAVPWSGHTGDPGLPTSDLEDPWSWLAGGELLMKNGRTLPESSRGQIALIRGLVDKGMCGLGDRAGCRHPELTPAATALADLLKFPVMVVPYSVGFAAIGRAVADAAGDGSAGGWP